MKPAYRILAYLVAIGVAVQAASIAYGFFGLVSSGLKGRRSQDRTRR
jgi:hypothetical protein